MELGVDRRDTGENHPCRAVSWGAKAISNYAKRYKYNGNISVSYANQKFGEKYLDDYNELQNFRVNWTHNQDAKARPDRRFSASVNAGSSGFGRYQNTTSRQYLQNELSSSITFNKSWIGKPYNFSAAINHNQNTLLKTISIKLPELTFNVARILPFQKVETKNGFRWLKTLGFSYTTNLRNQIDGYAMIGDASLFARQDGVEASWRVVDQILTTPTPVYEYEPGTWGPSESQALIAPFGGWQSPQEHE